MGNSSDEESDDENNTKAKKIIPINDNNLDKNNFGAKPVVDTIKKEKKNLKLIEDNIIKMQMIFTKEDVNKPTKILYNINEMISGCDLKELNESNTELYINGKQYKYKSYFSPDKIGIYDIQLHLNFLMKNCCCLFYGLPNLINIDLSAFNTRNVTNMSYMFYQCRNLQSLNLASFNTEKVTDMSNMFYDCHKLQSLDLSSFNTQKVNNMNNMFYGCYRLENLDLSSFNTKNVKKFDKMFESCYNIERVILSYEASNISKFMNKDKIFYA